MKLKIVLSIAVIAMVQLFLAGMAPDVKAVSITGLYNTGVDDSGNVLTNASTDSHYDIVSSPLGAINDPYVRNAAGFPLPPWLGVNTDSAWILPNSATNHSPGVYVHELTFNMTGLNAATASITGQWATDDTGIMTLNGTSIGTGLNATGFSSWTTFTITGGFYSGLNTLAFSVTNGNGGSGNPTGLRVEMTGSADADPVPEPATIALLGIGLVGLAGGAARRRWKKKAVNNS